MSMTEAPEAPGALPGRGPWRRVPALPLSPSFPCCCLVTSDLPSLGPHLRDMTSGMPTVVIMERRVLWREWGLLS